MEGLVAGRIVYFVFDESSAAEVNRRRTTGAAIAAQLRAEGKDWPEGAQAHIGNPVTAGEIVPAMVVGAWGNDCVNLKVLLDGSDTYWATSVGYDAEKRARSWHWMFDGQAGRYAPLAPAPETQPSAVAEGS